jgi:hypothetical protein
MKEKIVYNKREWLNPKNHYDTGSLQSFISVNPFGLTSEIIINDCHRQVTLDLSVFNPKSLPQRYKKLLKIKAQIDGLVDAYQEAGDMFIEMKKESDERIKNAKEKTMSIV